MATRNLTLSTTRDKYGLVTVINGDGSLNRQYRITGTELAALHASGDGLPPGCSAEEWHEGRAWVVGKCVDVGEVFEANGYLVIKFDEQMVNGHVVESVITWAPGEWSGTPPNVSVAPAKLAEVVAQRHGSGRRPIEITDGVVR